MMLPLHTVSIKLVNSLLLLVGLLISTSNVNANEAPNNTDPILPKKDRSYVSGGLVMNEFRSVSIPYEETITPGVILGDNFPLTGQTYALALTYGTYITENFKTELRYNAGIREDTLDELLDVNINYAYSWYIGGTLPVNEYLSGYAQVGVSFYDADVKQKEAKRVILEEFGTSDKIVRPSPTEIDEDLFGTKFSMSWMLGIDLKLNERWFVAFEYGRLLNDTASNIKVYQAGTHLRYEF